MKIGENDSAHEVAKILQASWKFDFIYFLFFWWSTHLQIIESISPKAFLENSSAQWAILFLSITIYQGHSLSLLWKWILTCCILVHDREIYNEVLNNYGRGGGGGEGGGRGGGGLKWGAKKYFR